MVVARLGLAVVMSATVVMPASSSAWLRPSSPPRLRPWSSPGSASWWRTSVAPCRSGSASRWRSVEAAAVVPVRRRSSRRCHRRRSRPGPRRRRRPPARCRGRRRSGDFGASWCVHLSLWIDVLHPSPRTSREMVTPPSAAARTVPSVIKYLGSKRLLAPLIGDAAQALQARTAADLFAGTTRVGQALRRRGISALQRHRRLQRGLRHRLPGGESTGGGWRGCSQRCAPLPRAAGTSPARSASRPATSTPTTARRSTAQGGGRPARPRPVGARAAADEPDRGGRPGRLDGRRADGVPQAMGAAGAAAARAARAGRVPGPRGHRACGATPTSWPASSTVSTSRTSTRPTTSTPTSRTTTCGRPSTGATSPTTTASPASASTAARPSPPTTPAGRRATRWPT